VVAGVTTGADERPLPVLRATLAVKARVDRVRPGRGLLSMRKVTRPGRGPLGVEDLAVPAEGRSVRVRRYRPAGAVGRLPTHVLMHGGAYWAGNVESHDPLCTWYARTVPCQVFSVDYRLAPAHPYPAALDDCYAVLLWVAEQAAALGVDLARLSVGGVSAGGGLAAAAAMLARDRSGPALCLQLLEIPMLDPTMSQRSLDTYAHGFGLSRESVAIGWHHYLPEGAPDAYAGVFGADDLTGLPPAAVLTAGCDPLRDEGETYAARLDAARVPVSAYRASGHVHASPYLTRFLPSARRAVGWTTDALRLAYV
jgi:acetyl esterase